MNENLPKAVQLLLDKQEIAELSHAYCQACDRHDFNRMKSLYHDDAIDDHGAFFKGPAKDYIANLPRISENMEILHHNITTTNIWVDGTYAEGEIYVLAFHTARTEKGRVDVLVGSRFLDKYEKRNGIWKFSYRAHAIDWAHVQEPSQVRLDYPWFAGSNVGKPGGDDPSYGFFRLIRHGGAPG